MKPSPKPWRFVRSLYPSDGEHDFAILAGDGELIAETFGKSGEITRPPAEANAALIAAAPSMLDMLRVVTRYLDAIWVEGATDESKEALTAIKQFLEVFE